MVSNEGVAAPAPPTARVVAGAAVGDPNAPLPEQLVSAPAKLVHGGAPPYLPGARADGIEGALTLELIVSATGFRRERPPLTKTFGHGFDERPRWHAARSYTILTPALKDGKPVRVRMHWTMQFHLE